MQKALVLRGFALQLAGRAQVDLFDEADDRRYFMPLQALLAMGQEFAL